MAIVNPQRAAIDALLAATGLPTKPRLETLPHPLLGALAGGTSFYVAGVRMFPIGISRSSMPGSNFPGVNVLMIAAVPPKGQMPLEEGDLSAVAAIAVLRMPTEAELRRDIGNPGCDTRCVEIASVVAKERFMVGLQPTGMSKAYVLV